jgi:uncharacterized metal-binding protein
MPDLPKRKVGLIACSGEELATGTLSRVATRLVLEKLRPEVTVTLCLPLFLAGEKEERAFARVYPTIAIDGCDKGCAERATGKYSAPVADAVRVDQVLAELGIEVRPSWRRDLDDEGWIAAHRLADVIARRVDAILGHRAEALAATTQDSTADGAQPEVVTCSCGSGVPVKVVSIDGKPVEIVALPAIFEQFFEQGHKEGEAVADELFRMTGIYNPIPADKAAQYREILIREYNAFCRDRAKSGASASAIDCST